MNPAGPAPGADPADGAGPSRRWRVAVGAVLALSMGIGPLAIYILSALAPSITADLELSRTSFGSLATISFLVTAALAVRAGTIIDRLPSRAVLVALFLLGGGALAGIAVATSFVFLMVAVVLAGLAQALSNPATNRVLATSIAPGRRGLLMGVKQSGVQMCQFLAGATLPAAAVLLGWRGAALVTTVLAPLGIGLVLAVLRSERRPPEAERSGGRGARPSLPHSVWWLASYSLLLGAGLQATNVYVPLYAYEEVGLGAVAAGGTTGVLGAVGVGARLVWGRSAERARSIQLPLGIMAVGGIGAAGLFLSAGVLPWLVWLGVVIHGATAVAANAVTMMAVVTSAPGPQVGRASGVLALGLYVGFAVGPITFGALADATDGYGTGWATLMGVYLLAVLMMIVWARQSPPGLRRARRAVAGAGAPMREPSRRDRRRRDVALAPLPPGFARSRRRRRVLWRARTSPTMSGFSPPAIAGAARPTRTSTKAIT